MTSLVEFTSAKNVKVEQWSLERWFLPGLSLHMRPPQQKFASALPNSILTPLSLRLSLLNEAKEVRAAGLRSLRYLIRDTVILQKVLKLQVDYLIARWVTAFNRAIGLSFVPLCRYLLFSIDAWGTGFSDELSENPCGLQEAL